MLEFDWSLPANECALLREVGVAPVRKVTRVRREFTKGTGRVGRCVACEACDCVEEGGRTATAEELNSNASTCCKERKNIIRSQFTT